MQIHVHLLFVAMLKKYTPLKRHVPVHGMNSEVTIDSNYVSYYNGKYPDPYLYGTVLKKSRINTILNYLDVQIMYANALYARNGVWQK